MVFKKKKRMPHEMDKRNTEIYNTYINEGSLTMQDIAEQFGLSRQRVSSIIRAEIRRRRNNEDGQDINQI